jgi:O-antigen ligase
LLITLAIGLAGILVLAYTGNLFRQDLEIDEFSNQRLNDLPTFVRMIWDYFPFGSGLGSFQPLFQSYETSATFSYQYLNNAHNDYAQILIETGLFGACLLAAFLVWWGRSFVRAWSAAASGGGSSLERTAALITLLMLLHSIVDYPLRTAALSTIFAYCIAIMSSGTAREPAGRRRRSNRILPRGAKAPRKVTHGAPSQSEESA